MLSFTSFLIIATAFTGVLTDTHIPKRSDALRHPNRFERRQVQVGNPYSRNDIVELDLSSANENALPLAVLAQSTPDKKKLAKGSKLSKNGIGAHFVSTTTILVADISAAPTATPREQSLVLKGGKQLKKSKGGAFAGGIGAHFISTGVTAAPVETASASANVAQVSAAATTAAPIAPAAPAAAAPAAAAPDAAAGGYGSGY